MSSRCIPINPDVSPTHPDTPRFIPMFTDASSRVPRPSSRVPRPSDVPQSHPDAYQLQWSPCLPVHPDLSVTDVLVTACGRLWPLVTACDRL